VNMRSLSADLSPVAVPNPVADEGGIAPVPDNLTERVEMSSSALVGVLVGVGGGMCDPIPGATGSGWGPTPGGVERETSGCVCLVLD
jgi:hypothetical protein